MQSQRQRQVLNFIFLQKIMFVDSKIYIPKVGPCPNYFQYRFLKIYIFHIVWIFSMIQLMTNAVTWCQFHQLFTSAFFVQNFGTKKLQSWNKIAKPNISAFGEKISAKKARVKCWWNWRKAGKWTFTGCGCKWQRWGKFFLLFFISKEKILRE